MTTSHSQTDVANWTQSNHTTAKSHPLVETKSWDHHSTVFVSCIFIVVAAVVKIVYHRNKRIAHLVPESCVFIMFGCVFDVFFSETSSALAQLKPTFTMDLFFAVLLPPIMLESAYSLNEKHFYLNLGPILLYAIVGTVINIATIGPSLYAIVQLDSNKWLNIPNVPLLQLMIFGASLSAIDPVSVLAIFKDLKVKKSLYYLVFGESLLNDAVVMVIHRILFDTLRRHEPLSEGILLIGVVKFLIVSLGSIVIGLLFGAISALLTLVTRHVEDVEPILMITLAYTAYVSAEIFDWSGILSIIGCGLFQAEFAFKNISTRSRITVEHYTQTLSSISDIIIFIFLGMILVHTIHQWNAAFIFFTSFFCVLYRFLSVISLTYIVNHLIKPEIYIKFSEQLLMVHAGLRGAIAYALIATLTSDTDNSHGDELSKSQLTPDSMNLSSAVNLSLKTVNETIVNGTRTDTLLVDMSTFELLQTTTLFVIMLTVFVMGGTTKPLLNYLMIQREVSDKDESLFNRLNMQMFGDINKCIANIVSDTSTAPMAYRWVRWLNVTFSQRVFLRASSLTRANLYTEEEEDEDESVPGCTSTGCNENKLISSYELIIRRHICKQLKQKAKSILLFADLKPECANYRTITGPSKTNLSVTSKTEHNDHSILNGHANTIDSAKYEHRNQLEQNRPIWSNLQQHHVAHGRVNHIKTRRHKIKHLIMAVASKICLPVQSMSKHTPERVIIQRIQPQEVSLQIVKASNNSDGNCNEQWRKRRPTTRIRYFANKSLAQVTSSINNERKGNLATTIEACKDYSITNTSQPPNSTVHQMTGLGETVVRHLPVESMMPTINEVGTTRRHMADQQQHHNANLAVLLTSQSRPILSPFLHNNRTQNTNLFGLRPSMQTSSNYVAVNNNWADNGTASTDQQHNSHLHHSPLLRY